MPKSYLDEPHFKDETAAYAWVEARVWPDGRVCPHCGVIGKSGGPLKGNSTRIGAYKCYACRKPFTVKIGTIFEKSHIPLHIWLQAMFLLASSKKGISSNQLARTLGVTLKSAWFLSHRIREAMRDGTLAPFGSGGGDVELDETFLGVDPDARPLPKFARGTSWVEKMKVLTLIDRSTGRARSFQIEDLKAETIFPIIRANIAKEARFLTDEAARYSKIGREFAGRGVVNHSKDEYVSAEDATIHVNCAEGFFSVFKRGMRGTYQHCAKHHLHRYTAEFDFRYSHRAKLGVDDVSRFAKIVEGVRGKRLTYRHAGRRVEAETTA